MARSHARLYFLLSGQNVTTPPNHGYDPRRCCHIRTRRGEHAIYRRETTHGEKSGPRFHHWLYDDGADHPAPTGIVNKYYSDGAQPSAALSFEHGKR